MPRPIDMASLRRLGRSRVLRALGPSMFAECEAAWVPGTVAWCNFDLAREMGFRVPRSNRMTAELNDQLVSAFSYRLLPKTAVLNGRKSMKLFADRYGGEGIGYHRGSARGALYPWGDLFLKGIGATPLLRDDPDDFYHSHGGTHLWHGLYVAALGELCTNLFANGAARILAVIDQGDYTIYPSGELIPRGIEVRVGLHLRPAHVLLRRNAGVPPAWTLFLAMTRVSGQLVMSRSSRGTSRPDLRGTMLRIIDVQAGAAAEHARWRLPHVAVSPSNLQLDGSLLDLAQSRTNPRSVPMLPQPRVPETWIPRSDYMDLVSALTLTYRAVRRSLSERQTRRMNAGPLQVGAEVEKAYRRHLDVQLLRAAGIKQVAAERLQQQEPELVRQFADVLSRLSSLSNPAAMGKVQLYDGRAAVADVFGMLRFLPARYFRHPRRDLTDAIRSGLRLVHAGSRKRVARRKKAGETWIAELAKLYPAIMQACRRLALREYRSVAAMERSIQTRAEFENRPIESFYFDARYKSFTGAALQYRRDQDFESLRRLMDSALGSSVRNVDALLESGSVRRLPDGRWELQARRIAGIRYAVRASDHVSAKRRLHVELVVRRRADGFVVDLPAQPHLTSRQLESLRYVYSVDGWATQHVVRGSLQREGRGDAVMSFTPVRSKRPFGVLEGYFIAGRTRSLAIKDGGEPFRGYAFALPDGAELDRIVATRRTARRSR
jgi:hypothetical protein